MEVRVTVKEVAERAEEMEVVGLAVVVMAGAVRGGGWWWWAWQWG